MRFAAIADIHGNIDALDAVLADIADLGITQIVNLGDHISGPLAARRTAERLIASRITSVRGDQDRRLIELHKSGGSRRIDYRQLDQELFDWLASLPPTAWYADDVFLCHGSPVSDEAFWLDRISPAGLVEAAPLEDIEPHARDITAASLILCAHTHIPRAVRLSDGRLVVNPGSVGCPGYTGTVPVPYKVETGTPDACYAVLERRERGWRVSFRHVPYDPTAMAKLASLNGLPAWASTLATGWIR